MNFTFSNGSRCRIWLPPAIKDPILRDAPTRGFMGAISLSSGQFVRKMRRMFNLTFESLFERLLRQQTPGEPMLLVLDNARYHNAKLLAPFLRRHAQHVRRLFLPPYSPQLAHIERVGKLTRRFAPHNRYFGALLAAVKAVNACFDRAAPTQNGIATTALHYLSQYVQVESK